MTDTGRCEVCGDPLHGVEGCRRVGSCSTARFGARTGRTGIPAGRSSRTCVTSCGQPVKSTRLDQRWCSRRCRTLANRQMPAVRRCVVCELEYSPVRFQQKVCDAAYCRRELKGRRSEAARRAAGVEPIEVVRERARSARVARLGVAAAAKLAARRCVDCGGAVEGRRQWCEDCRKARDAARVARLGVAAAAVRRLRRCVDCGGARRGPAAVVRGLPESEGRGEGGPGVCGPGEACGEGGEPEGALGVRTVILSPLGLPCRNTA